MTDFSTLPTYALILLVLLALLELTLKGITLWKSGRNGQKGWFVALLVLNTAGILPLIYLLTQKKTA
jgi:hypothetical protein